MKQIRVLLVDDHVILLDSLSLLLGSIKGITVVGTASNGHEALSILEMEPIDVVLADLHMPQINGIALTRKIREQYPKTRVLILSMSEEADMIRSALQAGIDGYLPKKANRQELEQAIQTVVAGQKYFSNSIQPHLFTNGNSGESSLAPLLTRREREILILIVKGLTNQEIGDKLFISSLTVETHRRNLFKKVNVSNALELMRYAVKNGLINDL